MTKRSLKIINKSNYPQKVALYQVLNNVDGYPLVWFSKYIVSGNSYQFSWDTKWGLSWGTTGSSLKPGLIYKSHTPIQPVTPSPNLVNGIKIGYEYVSSGNDGDFTQTPTKNSHLVPGEISISTTTDFSMTDAEGMCISVYVDENPIFSMQGRPNGNYIIDTHTEYYLAVTEAEEGTVLLHEETASISGYYISNPVLVDFSGESDKECTLEDHMLFYC